ncbi:MAG: hypothetical protein E7384_04285 [Ruminococcaceae bacterium]|nr:hypothetical protein [Oscillospiraceae bacterium]
MHNSKMVYNEVVISGNEKVKGVLFEWGIKASDGVYTVSDKKEIPLEEVTMEHIEPTGLFDTECGFHLVIHAVVNDVLYLATVKKSTDEKTLARISVDVNYEYTCTLSDGTQACFYIKPILK